MMGEIIELNVTSETPLIELRLMIFMDLGLLPEDQILMFNNRELKDEEKCLGEFGIEDMDTVMLMVRLETGLIW